MQMLTISIGESGAASGLMSVIRASSALISKRTEGCGFVIDARPRCTKPLFRGLPHRRAGAVARTSGLRSIRRRLGGFRSPQRDLLHDRWGSSGADGPPVASPGGGY